MLCLFLDALSHMYILFLHSPLKFSYILIFLSLFVPLCIYLCRLGAEALFSLITSAMLQSCFFPPSPRSHCLAYPSTPISHSVFYDSTFIFKNASKFPLRWCCFFAHARWLRLAQAWWCNDAVFSSIPNSGVSHVETGCRWRKHTDSDTLPGLTLMQTDGVMMLCIATRW